MDDGQVGQHVLDLGPVEEPRAADDAVRDAVSLEGILDGVRLGIGAVEDGAVFEAGGPGQSQDAAGDEVCLLGAVGGGVDRDLVAFAVVGPEGLALAAVVVGDDGVGGVQDGLGGAVILLQTDGPRPLVLIFKIQDVLDGGAPEPVDGLIVIAHHAQIFVPARQKAGQQILHVIGVLILVHQDIAEFSLIMGPDGLVLLQKLHRQIDDVVKIDGVVLLQPGLIAAVALGDLGHADVVLLLGLGRALLGGDHADLLPGDDGQHQLRREGLVIQSHVLDDILHHLLGVGGVVDGEAPGVAQVLNVGNGGIVVGVLIVLPQDPAAGCMEGHGPDARASLAQHPHEPLLQLTGGLVCKRDGQDPVGIHRQLGAEPVGPCPLGPGQDRGQLLEKFGVLLDDPLGDGLGFVAPSEADQIGDPVDEDGGLAASGTGQQQQGALGGQGSGALHGVQIGKLGFEITPPGGQKTFFKCVIHNKHLYLCFFVPYMIPQIRPDCKSRNSCKRILHYAYRLKTATPLSPPSF